MIGLLGLLVVTATTASAQQQVRVEVRDDQGMPVGFALVALVGGASQVASDSGAVTIRLRAADSLNLRVRRIGYREHFGWVARGTDGAYHVTLPRVAATLSTVDVTAAGSASNTPLMQRGFYDRVDRVQKGAILGDFYTPEALDERARVVRDRGALDRRTAVTVTQGWRAGLRACHTAQQQRDPGFSYRAVSRSSMNSRSVSGSRPGWQARTCATYAA